MFVAYAAAKRGPPVGRIRTAAEALPAPIQQPNSPSRPGEIRRRSRWPPVCAALAIGNASLADCCRRLALRKRSPFRRITPWRHVARRIRQGGRLRLNAGRAYASSGVAPAFPASLMLWRNGGKRRLAFVSTAVPPQTTAEAARSFVSTYGLRQTRRLSPRGRRTPFARDRKALSGDRGSKPSPQLASHPARFVSFSRPPRAAPLRALRPLASDSLTPAKPPANQKPLVFIYERLFIFMGYDMVGEVKMPCYRLFLCAK